MDTVLSVLSSYALYLALVLGAYVAITGILKFTVAKKLEAIKSSDGEIAGTFAAKFRSICRVIPSPDDYNSYRSFAIYAAAIAASYLGATAVQRDAVKQTLERAYSAYCESDVVGEIMRWSISASTYRDPPSARGCEELSAPTKATQLSFKDAYFILGQLKLLTEKETKNSALLDPASQSRDRASPNAWLVEILTGEQGYVPGESTTILLRRVANGLGANTRAGEPEISSSAACDSALIAALLAQQPFGPADGNHLVSLASTLRGQLPQPAIYALARSYLAQRGELQADASKVVIDHIRLATAQNAGTSCLNAGLLGHFGYGSELTLPNQAAWKRRPLASPAEIVEVILHLSGASDERIGMLVTARADGTTLAPPIPADAAAAQAKAILSFMEAIVVKAGGLPVVQDAEIASNFFVGWERFVIVALSIFLAIVLIWRSVWRIPADIKTSVLSSILEANAKAAAVSHRDLILAGRALGLKIATWNAAASAPTSVIAAAPSIMQQNGTTANAPANPTPPQTGDRIALIEAPEDRVDTSERLLAAAEAMLSPRNGDRFDRGRMNRIAEDESLYAEHGRFLFLAALPILPTVGFIGTVSSLIDALALAQNLPRASTALAQVLSFADVASTLALCFSTTLLALLSLLVFAPIDLWQSLRERRVVEEPLRMLNRHLAGAAEASA